jgi:hypothetical protein
MHFQEFQVLCVSGRTHRIMARNRQDASLLAKLVYGETARFIKG